MTKMTGFMCEGIPFVRLHLPNGETFEVALAILLARMKKAPKREPKVSAKNE